MKLFPLNHGKRCPQGKQMSHKVAAIYPEVFHTGMLPDGCSEGSALAMAFTAWANILSGNRPPKCFGRGMVVIGQKLGTSVTLSSLEEYANKNGYSNKTTIEYE